MVDVQHPVRLGSGPGSAPSTPNRSHTLKQVSLVTIRTDPIREEGVSVKDTGVSDATLQEDCSTIDQEFARLRPFDEDRDYKAPMVHAATESKISCKISTDSEEVDANARTREPRTSEESKSPKFVVHSSSAILNPELAQDQKTGKTVLPRSASDHDVGSSPQVVSLRERVENQTLIMEMETTIEDLQYQLQASSIDLSRLRKELTDKRIQAEKDRRTIQQLSDEVHELREALCHFENQPHPSTSQQPDQHEFSTPQKTGTLSSAKLHDSSKYSVNSNKNCKSCRRTSMDAQELSQYPSFSYVYSSELGSNRKIEFKLRGSHRSTLSFSSDDGDSECTTSTAIGESADLKSCLTQTREALTMFGPAPLLHIIQSGDAGLRSIAAKSLADLSEQATAKQEMASNDGIPILLQALTESSFDSSTATHLAAILANIATESSTHSRLVKHGGVTVLQHLLQTSTSEECKCMAAGALSNVCTNRSIDRALVESGVLRVLVNAISSPNKKLVAHAVRGLANIFPALDNTDEHVTEDFVVSLLLLCGSSDISVVRHVAIILYYISKSSETRSVVISLNGLSIIESMTVVKKRSIDKLAQMILAHFSANE
uniref:Vacuolar protein 8 n=1 Tax=Picocystis salinarum TaxID=88271 RepID=A0A7S3UD17_9CHLO|mmetsp:Transcript_2862/g.17796  ORF Transcript_2862/g.17796 Transcript_2862/m.17796 type:complete len:602 (+) Transcript_2862:312-2117(+)